MTAFTTWLEPLPLVAILRGVRPHEAVSIGQALAEAGFRIIEVPLNSPEPFDSIDRLAVALGDGVLVGAGTVVDPADVPRVAGSGGRLVVAPNADRRVVAAAKEAGLYALPGFATPTEAFAMIAAGADGLKLFPAEASPPAVLKAMKSVLPAGLPVLPVGSITPEAMADYRTAGAAGFGLGSALYRAGDDAAAVAERAARFSAARLIRTKPGGASKLDCRPPFTRL
jgi:2-dehydro-3-deoxyphosphogalactonate aldolase